MCTSEIIRNRAASRYFGVPVVGKRRNYRILSKPCQFHHGRLFDRNFRFCSMSELATTANGINPAGVIVGNFTVPYNCKRPSFLKGLLQKVECHGGHRGYAGFDRRCI